MSSEPISVRPTKVCLEQIGVKIPNLATNLADLDHPVVAKAQTIPESVEANGATRIVSLKEKLWWRVKVGDWRGGASCFEPPEDADTPYSPCWWLALAGKRKGDSTQDDFYDNLPADPLTRTPGSWDWRRWNAEVAVASTDAVQRTVRNAARHAVKSGTPTSFRLAARQEVRIRIAIKNNDEAYLAVAVDGIPDAKTFALVLSSFPGVENDAWLAEPEGVLGLHPERGEIIYSTILTTEAQQELWKDDEM